MKIFTFEFIRDILGFFLIVICSYAAFSLVALDVGWMFVDDPNHLLARGLWCAVVMVFCLASIATRR